MNASSGADDVLRQREAEHKAWSRTEREKLARGDLASLEQAIATNGIVDLTAADRVRLIENFVERCRRERPTVAPSPGSMVAIEHHTRSPQPLKLASKPTSPGRPLPGLLPHRHGAWALCLWATAVGSGALTLKLLFVGN